MDLSDRLSEEVRLRTLARFEAHRQAWAANPALRALYQRWYGQVRAQLPDPRLGRWIEIGSGPGLAQQLIPELELSDVVQAPWHTHQLAAEALPFGEGQVGALVLFDVLHHLRSPARFLAEATRVLAPGGRVVLCEPYVSPLSFPIYRFLHEEGCDLSVDPLASQPSSASSASSASSDDPFEGNQAIPTLMFGRHRRELERRFPSLRLTKLERLAGPSYPASGGFSGRPLPRPLFRALLAIEDRLPAMAFRLIGFRLLAVLERV
jgi:SAM-dependent methyltransferase